MQDSGDGDGPPLVVVMGVSGSGKTSVAEPVAERLGVPFGEGDDFHPQANVAKMAAGHPLSDDDRWPWLDEIGAWLAARAGTGAVITCSALRRSYRDRLRAAAPGLRFLQLAAPYETLAGRLAARRGHYMPASLLQSQFDTLEPLQPDEAGTVLDVTQGVDTVVRHALAALRG